MCVMAEQDTSATISQPESESGSDAGAVSLFPRRKLGGSPPSKHRAPVKLDYQTLEGLFDMPQPDAARELGIALTTLKHACRRLGVPRWPYSRKRVACSAQAADEHARADCSQSCSASPRARDDGDMEMERNVKRKPSFSVSPVNVSMQQLSGDSSPEVYNRRHDPVIDDPFAAYALNEDSTRRATDLARYPAAADLDPAAGVGAAGPAAQKRADSDRIGGWAVPCNLWLVPNEVTKEAERNRNFWSLGLLEVPSAELDALARRTVSAIDAGPV